MSLSIVKAKLIRRLYLRRSREREGLVLVEGVRGVKEALLAGAEAKFALVAPGLEASPGGTALSDRLESEVEVIGVEDSELAELSATEAPQGVLLVCGEPRGSLDMLQDSVAPLLLLDGIQDPGNVGTLIRTARGMGFAGAICLDGTADPWTPKAMRASAGAAFGLPIVRTPWDEVERWIVSEGITLLAGEAQGSDVATARPEGRWCLAVGNEGAGLRDGIRAAAHLVCIPMPGGLESLNVSIAGAILMYALTQPITPASEGE